MSNYPMYSVQDVKQRLIEARIIGKHIGFTGAYTTISYSPKTESYTWSYFCGEPECGCEQFQTTKDISSLWFADEEYRKSPE